jgi:hypothetical protein
MPLRLRNIIIYLCVCIHLQFCLFGCYFCSSKIDENESVGSNGSRGSDGSDRSSMNGGDDDMNSRY